MPFFGVSYPDMCQTFSATRLVRTQLEKWEIDPAIR